MIKTVVLAEFLAGEGVILDVRSPSEYRHAHIPGAVNLPLFTDEQRAAVGTLYKSQGQAAAIEEGLRLVGPKLCPLVNAAKQALAGVPAKVHCWRGGLRSGSVGWLLTTAGIPTMVLQGGYKVFRQHVCRLWTHISPRLLVLGGLTGSGKTALLELLREAGEQVLNLEQLAHHRGSTYGNIGLAAQPSHEQFENQLALACQAMDLARPVWVEDESRMIGHCQIPATLFECMKSAPCVILDIPLSERIRYLVAEYGAMPLEQLIRATRRLERRLGTQRMLEAIRSIEKGELSHAVEIILDYYDRTYRYGIAKRKRPVDVIGCNALAQECAIRSLLQWAATQ
jgi:tRNA 2-selenouridine synthase